ncbi:replication factor A [Babesia ovis]|uniref:Replication protein A subunit n=1 Tax=Babesia ovis TaxID=5869 RepID=A0A9W5WW79_BABOV|nr:replication factor A [Babesia ovis]
MSLPRTLTPDFFSKLTDSIHSGGESFFQELHECNGAVKVLCIQQSCIAESKYLVEVLDGSVPVKYKHTCLALIPATVDGDKQLVGKIISFNQYKVTPTKSRYLIILTKIAILPGDFRHLTTHLGPGLVYYPGLSVKQQEHAVPQAAPVQRTNQPLASGQTNDNLSGPIRNSDDHGPQRKPQSAPYTDAPKPVNTTGKPVVKTADGGTGGPINIADLTIYTPKWMIRARVVTKSQIRKFNNQWGEGQLFSIDLCDSSGDIRGTFFGEAVTKWYHFIEEGQVYSITGGQLKPANKKFNSLSHACEISLDENAQILLDRNDDSIPAIRCSFTPINQIENMAVGTIIDVVGVVARCNEVKSLQHKATGTNLEKRELLLCDTTGANIWITLWGKKVQQLQNNELEGHPVIAFKGVKVGEWQGKRLDTQASTKVTFNPVLPEAGAIKQWWATTGSQMKIDTGKQSAEPNIEDIMSIKQLTQAANQAFQFRTLGDNGIVLTTRAMVEVIKENTFSWPACMDCQRKMIKETGHWVCTRCRSTNKPRHTYILSLKIADDTGSLWATASGYVGEEIMHKVSAEDALALSDNNDVNAAGKNFVNIFEEARLSEYIFKVRVFSETYMDERRLKYRISKAIRMGRCVDAAVKCRLKEIGQLL